MIPVLTKEEAYKLDKDTIESGYLSQEQLMDNAGKAIAQFFCEKIDDPFNQKVVVVCGKGNNGGDGVIAHHYLKKYNVSSEIVFTEQKHGHTNLIKKYKISKGDYFIYNDKTKFDKYDWVIDGIFGIGLSRELNDKYTNMIHKIVWNDENDEFKNANVISIDMPTAWISPKYTVTFGYPKESIFFDSARVILSYSHDSIIVSDIGLKKSKSNVLLVEENDVIKLIKPFCLNNIKHKYTNESKIIAGSDNMPGAAYLACRSALVTGSGYISLYAQLDNENLIHYINSSIPEVVIKDINESQANPSYDEPDFLYCTWNRYTSNTLIGPGCDPIELQTIFNSKFDEFGVANSYVLDAGAIKSLELVYNKIDENKNIFSLLPSKCILTPHWSEFQTLLHKDFESYDDIENSLLFLKKVQNMIGGNIVILKSFNTFIITKNVIYIMDNGPSLLATAGTGDVLSGILVSLLSQGYSRLEASILGTYLHAEAANYYMNNISKDGMTASDLIDCIPHAFNKLRGQSVN
ncbi:MAG: NAD(P)H-hydrate dehydratase [Candidatus Marinimicrobia bacterium]|nr:NAD(P)H-hydrate dehydratase [Candidatus Neomarinimicrobiota bacterium]|tara:strand:+ start:3045 stop:4604 length:1560 start_codon:yes stop_codon:yes gene_type:complete